MRNIKINRTKLNLVLDIIIALAFAAEMQYRFVGLRNHEILGLAFGAAIIVHLALHVQWIVGVTKRFFKNLLHQSHVNYILNIALLVDIILVTVSGILISRTLGLTISADHSWEQIHKIAANLSLVIVALHVGLHWQWIAANSQKYLFGLWGKLPKLRLPSKAITLNQSSNVAEV
ncbi:MAG: DUF4405 domain-containing protein [Anaerolineae bacterium]|nr:DUF4405 domain-containing protein [Anaerolineae bacterium]